MYIGASFFVNLTADCVPTLEIKTSTNNGKNFTKICKSKLETHVVSLHRDNVLIHANTFFFIVTVSLYVKCNLKAQIGMKYAKIEIFYNTMYNSNRSLRIIYAHILERTNILNDTDFTKKGKSRENCVRLYRNVRLEKH